MGDPDTRTEAVAASAAVVAGRTCCEENATSCMWLRLETMMPSGVLWQGPQRTTAARSTRLRVGTRAVWANGAVSATSGGVVVDRTRWQGS